MKIPLLIGLFAALAHVLSGPDHLAAVTPLVLENKKKHYKIGLFWGIGHVFGMLLIGMFLYFLKDFVPVDKISAYSEKFVGIILIGIGLWALYRIKNPKHKHIHPHLHKRNGEDYLHIHQHQHQTDIHTHTHQNSPRQNITTAFLIGIIHGFAGVSHFILMLPVLGYSSSYESIEYMLGFAMGTVFAMTIYALVIGRFHRKQDKPIKIYLDIRFWSGILAILIGVYWLFVN